MRWLALIAAVAGCGRRSFDELRPDSVPPGFCNTATFSNPPASSVMDDFTTPFTDRWRPNPTLCIDQVGTELVATPSNTTGQYCFATTLGDLHLTCDSVFVRVPEVTSPVLKVQTLIYVSSLTQAVSYNLLLEGGGLQMGMATSPFDPVRDVWWRLGEHDGEVTFDASPDGLTWRELMRTPTPFSLDHVSISIGAGTYDTPPASPGQVRFRCYNVPPPCN